MNPFSVPRARKPCNDSFFVVRYLFLRYFTSEFRMNGSIQRSFLMFWLCSAAVVTGARLFNPIPMSLDLAFQIQAAQNLLAGHGLSVFSRYAPDVAAPSGLVLLTVFPSGYSLFTAAILALGGSEGIAVRSLAVAGTMLGWWGWGMLAYPFFSEKMERTVVWKWAGFLIALSTPLLFTASGAGTDLFLWAAVPWVLIWVVRGSNEEAPGAARFDLMAGAVCGLASLMRYASLFLAAYAVLLILRQSGLRLRVLCRRWAFFGLGLVPGLAVQVYINEFLTSGPARPAGLSFDVGFGFAVRRALEGLPLLTTANFPWTFWFPGIALNLLFPDASGRLPWQLAITIAIYVFLALIVKMYRSDLRRGPHDLSDFLLYSRFSCGRARCSAATTFSVTSAIIGPSYLSVSSSATRLQKLAMV